MIERRPTRFWSSWWRVAGLAGIVFGVAIAGIEGWLMLRAPSFDDPLFRIREYFTESGTTWMAIDFAESLLFAVLLLIFASGLRGFLGRAEGGYAMWSRLTFGGALVAATAVLAGSTFWKGIALGGAETLDGTVLRTFMQFDAVLFTSAVMFAYGLMVLAASVVIVRTGVLPRWLGWVGFVVVAITAVGAAWPIDGDPEGILALIGVAAQVIGTLWVVSIGMVLVRTKEAPLHLPGEGLFDPAEFGSLDIRDLPNN